VLESEIIISLCHCQVLLARIPDNVLLLVFTKCQHCREYCLCPLHVSIVAPLWLSFPEGQRASGAYGKALSNPNEVWGWFSLKWRRINHSLAVCQ